MALAVTGRDAAAASVPRPAPWLLMLPDDPVRPIAVYGSAEACELGRARHTAAARRAWLYRIAQYQERLAIAMEPRDDIGRALLWRAWADTRRAHRIFDLYRTGAVCRPG